MSLVDLILREDENILSLLSRVTETVTGTPERAEAEKELTAYTGSLALRDKVDAYSRIMAFFESQLSGATDEVDRLHKRKANIQKAFAHLQMNAVLALSMVEPDIKGRQKLVGNHSTLTLRDNPEAVDDVEWFEVPSKFVKITVTLPLDVWNGLKVDLSRVDRMSYSVMKDAIKAAVKNGEHVPGATLSRTMRVQRS